MDAEGARGPVGLYESVPRGIIPLEGFRVPRSVARALRRHADEPRVDAAFTRVVAACARDRDGVWLTPRLEAAYARLHRLGVAHSVEAWRDGRLVAGLFGVALGGLFTSESMFHTAPDAGHLPLVHTARLLNEGGFTLWDVQTVSPHLARFGAVGIDPHEYRRRLARALPRRAVFPPGTNSRTGPRWGAGPRGARPAG
jgi:leucyl/phenylalanyl-tRNA--protein transferase